MPQKSPTSIGYTGIPRRAIVRTRRHVFEAKARKGRPNFNSE